MQINNHNIVFQDSDEHDPFVTNFVNKSTLFNKYSLNFSNPTSTDLGLFIFCDLISNIQDIKKSKGGCHKFVPISTGHGLCHSFNSLPSKDIYQESEFSNIWINVFEKNKALNRTYPSAYGPSKHLYFFLQSFEVYSQKISKDFTISISNDFNPFDVGRQIFSALPGYYHSLRIIPSQVFN